MARRGPLKAGNRVESGTFGPGGGNRLDEMKRPERKHPQDGYLIIPPSLTPGDGYPRCGTPRTGCSRGSRTGGPATPSCSGTEANLGRSSVPVHEEISQPAAIERGTHVHSAVVQERVGLSSRRRGRACLLVPRSPVPVVAAPRLAARRPAPWPVAHVRDAEAEHGRGDPRRCQHPAL